jgi:hypothetical protein
MDDEMLYFFITEAALASNAHHKINTNFPIEAVFVICAENNKIDPHNTPNLAKFEKIFPISNGSPEIITSEIVKICNKFPDEKSFFIDRDALPRENLFRLHNFLSQKQKYVYFVNFKPNNDDDDNDKNFTEIKPDENELMLFDNIQAFDEIPEIIVKNI